MINIEYQKLMRKNMSNFIFFIVSQNLDISFNPWDISNKQYSRTHKIVEDWVSWVPFISAFHKSHGIIEEIIIVSDNPDKTLFHFQDNNKFAKQIYYGQVGIYNFFLKLFSLYLV